ncbi:hypothetical protein J7K19_00685 [bacterium]|nr:hypothetical protein [bacterium]
MFKLRKAISLLMIAGFLFSVIVITGCTRYANEEQLKTLDETKAAALSAEQKVEKLKTEKANLEKELEAKKAELQKVQQEKKTVQQRLEQLGEQK